ncbi:MAG: MATE family efflux transporter [Acidobacteriota bacterium]|nr:MATE family efflux transporter [Acidobacteriota bacterium]
MQDLTTGSISRHVLKTTSFMLVTMVFQTLYFLVDLYWIGRLGSQAVAAVSIAGNLTFIVLALSQMLGVGTTTLVSHAVGQKDKTRALLVFNQAQLLSVVSGALFVVVGLALRPWYVGALAADPVTASLASEFLGWFIPAMGLQFGLVALASALRGTGNFKPGMIVGSVTVLLNMLLAPFLIFGWGTGLAFGVAGAAMSSFVSVAIGVAWLATYLFRENSYLRFVRGDLAPQWHLWGQLLKIGLPAGTEFALMAVYLFIVYSISRPFGAAAQAGFGIGLRIVQAGFMPIVALGFGVAPVAGQNFGARRPERVRQAFQDAIWMAAGAMAAFALPCLLAPAPMVAFFSSDPEVIAVGEQYLRIVAWSFIGSGVTFVVSSTFQAMGNSIPPLLTSFARILVFAIPAFILARAAGFDLKWLWYLSTATILMQMALNLVLVRREFARKLVPMEAAAG